MESNARLNFFLALVVTSGIVLSVFSGWSLYNVEEKAIVSEFQKDVDERAASVYRELSINFETLRSLAILFRDETIPKYEEFSHEAKKIINRHHDIQALEWIPHIVQSERVQYVSKIRQHFPDYEISGRKEQGVMVLEKRRQDYYPVYYIEPLAGNEAALGFDLASNPRRVETLEKSRDTALPLVSAGITLVQESGNQTGFLAFFPIYRGNPITIDSRRKALVGFIVGVFRVGDIFVSSALSDIPPGIEIKLIDEISSTENDILYIHKSRAGVLHESITYRKELPEVWGRKWGLFASPTQSYIAARQSLLPQVIFSFGIAFTIFIALYIKIIAKQTSNIKKIVIEKTDALSEANKQLELLSFSDALSGIPNRRAMDNFLNKEWFRAIRNRSFISFILIDIDFFKLYNDNYGHLMGDECLKNVATKLKEITRRATDLVARYGGEEFALVLAETENAEAMAECCRQSIEQLQILHEYSEAGCVVTVSVGLCTYSPKKGDEPSLIIDCADKALYKAKRNGRNKVEVILLDCG